MCKIVVVDDEHLEIESFKHIVSEMENVQVIGEGRCGRAAVELCATLKPDIAFINCNMGGMDGFEAARRIRNSDKEIVIIMTTGYDRRSSLRGLLALDINEYLLKPIRPETIVEVINKYRKPADPSAPSTASYQREKLDFYPRQILSKEITRALIYIDHHYKEPLSLESVAEIIPLSSYYFSRLFKREVGVNFSDFLLHKRLENAKRILETTDESILDVSLATGFREQSYFCKVFKKHNGLTPSDYRKSLKNRRRQKPSKE